jgi:hypothetical protein
MVNRGLQRLFLLLSTILLSPFALAQVMSIPSSGFGNIGDHGMGNVTK